LRGGPLLNCGGEEKEKKNCNRRIKRKKNNNREEEIMVADVVFIYFPLFLKLEEEMSVSKKKKARKS